MDECSEPKVKSLAKSLKILSCFTIQEPVLGVTELAERIGVTKSNIHNILSTFTSMGYLDRLPDGRYTLGLKILEYAFIINQNLGYPNAVYDILVDTAGKTNEIVYFGLPYGTNVLYLYVAHPANRMGVLPYRDILGETSPFYCTGIGKAILAHMPEEEWLAHIPAERTRFQPNTITDLDAIVEELRRTRRRGLRHRQQRAGPQRAVCGCSCVQLCRQAGGRGEHLRPGHYHDGREADGVRRHPAKCGPAHAGAHLPLSPPHHSVFYVCLPSSPEDAGTYRNKKETKRDK